MTALELLSDLRDRGVKLWVDGTDLRFSARKGTLGRAATELLVRHKTELVELLKSPDAGATTPRPDAARTKRFSLDDQAIVLSSVPDWHQDEQDPYVRYVAPYKGFLYQRLALDKKFVRGEGCFLFDAEGTPYADFIAQFGAVPFGHDPEPIWDALEAVRRESRPNLVITSISAAAGELAERLLAVAPAGLGHAVFTNSGAEAVEAAIKLARARTGRLGILSARDGFHGLTLAGMSATGREFFQRGFGAPVPGFNYVPFGDLEALQTTLEFRPDFFAAFVVEIVQGESGIHVAPQGYLAKAAELCHRFGALLIVDEVQTGLGRTGRLLASDHDGIKPDGLILGKALGGGLLPVSAFLAREDLMAVFTPGDHGSTFGGNPLSAAVGHAALRLLREEKLADNAQRMGERLLTGLRAIQHPAIRQIRGKGLLIGMDLDPSFISAREFCERLMQQGILSKDTHDTVVRFAPPLVITANDIDAALEAIRHTFSSLSSSPAHLTERSYA